MLHNYTFNSNHTIIHSNLTETTGRPIIQRQFMLEVYLYDL